MAGPVPLLSLRGLTRSYGAVRAVDGIDLDVGPGQVHAVLGENGAGKSTLMRLVSGVERPDAGTLAWEGRVLPPLTPAEARRLGIAMVFQHFSLFESLTVLENAALVIPGPRGPLAARLRGLGERFGLAVDPAARVGRLSVGERQRVEILRCLLTGPRLLILDEPTAVLPPQGVERLFATLRSLRDDGLSILFISHKLDEIRSLCDAATVLRGGRVVGACDPRAVPARALAAMMIGHEMPPAPPRAAARPGAVLLEVAGLDRPAGPFGTALRSVSLRVRAGEIVGIAGVSGNGQAELAAALSGEAPLAPGQGDAIRLMGEPAGRLDAGARRDRGLGVVPEERLGRGAVPEMALWLNGVLTGHRAGLVRRGLVDRARARAFARGVMRDSDVRAPSEAAEAAALSGGNLQKFVMGREIALAPRVLLACQPTWGVDVGAAAALRARLAALRDDGCAILLISEEIEELFECCDRLHVIRAGRLSEPLDVAGLTVAEVGARMTGAHEGSLAAAPDGSPGAAPEAVHA